MIDQQTTILRSKNFIGYLKEADNLLFAAPNYFRDILYKNKIIISKETILNIYESTPAHERFIDKIQAVKSRLLSYWEQRIVKQAQSVDTQNQILSLSEELQQKYFSELIQDDSEAGVFSYSKKFLRKKYRRIGSAIANNQWVDIKSMFEFIYESYAQKPYISNDGLKTLDEAVIRLFIQNHFVEKIAVPKMRFVLIDEVQDYTSAQMALLLELFPKSEFTLVGDENQAIFNSHISFNEISSLFEEANIHFSRYDLLNSYRSSGAITQLFRELVTDKEKMKIVPVRPFGNSPKIFEFRNSSDFWQIVADAFQALGGAPLTIITKTEEESKVLLSQISKKKEWRGSEVTVLPLSLVKGLEFDSVLIYDVSVKNFYSEQDKRILYTAISRGMQNLYITYRNEKSPFLSKLNLKSI